MCLLFSFIPASVLTTLSYFVWFTAARAEGPRQRLGNYLAIWLLVVSLLLVACGAFMTFTGRCPLN